MPSAKHNPPLSHYPPPKGRGALSNPASRFDDISHEDFFDDFSDNWWLEQKPEPKTTVLPDKSRSVLSRHDSPDLGHRQTLNPYRGCEHGCVYCFARPTHNQFGLSSGLDFETRLFAKYDIADLLQQELSRSSYRVRPIMLGAVTDAYQPVERKLMLTRSAVSILCKARHPFTTVTKSALVVRDLDLLAPAAAEGTAAVAVSLTTLNKTLARKLEPRAATPARRLATIHALARAGVPVTVLMAPVIPGLNDHEIEQIVKAARDAGARSAGYVLLRLPWDLKTLFEEWLTTHYPDRRDRVLSLIRQTRNGKLYEHEWEWRRRGRGVVAKMIADRFALAKKRSNMDGQYPPLRSDLFIPPGGLDLFAKKQL